MLADGLDAHVHAAVGALDSRHFYRISSAHCPVQSRPKYSSDIPFPYPGIPSQCLGAVSCAGMRAQQRKRSCDSVCDVVHHPSYSAAVPSRFCIDIQRCYINTDREFEEGVGRLDARPGVDRYGANGRGDARGTDLRKGVRWICDPHSM